MLVEPIKSRPVYKGITVDPRARRHIFVLEGEGANALLEQKDKLTPAILAETDILYVARGSVGRGYEEALAALDAGSDWTAPTVETLLFRLKVVLGSADMGTRLYIAGTEGFIGQAMQIALRAAGVRAGDKVLTNAFTLAPVPGAIAAVGGEPVLVEITEDLVIDLDDLAAKASARANLEGLFMFLLVELEAG